MSLVLEVTIGIIFIYLLYSLLATIIMEIVATFLGLRARNLRNAISRMLDNKLPEYKGDNYKLTQYFMLLWSGIWQFFRPDYGPASGLFYRQPIIRLSTEGRFFNKPSYLKSSQFAQALLTMFQEQEEGASLTEKLDNSLLVPGGSIVSETTKRHLRSLWEKVDRDVVLFRSELEGWFDNTMERASGWYKRDSQAILLIIGLLLAILFNASTIDLIHILSKDKEIRAQMVNLAEAYVANRSNSPNESTSSQMDSLLRIQKQLQRDAKDANNILGIGWQIPDGLPVRVVDSIKWENLQNNPLLARVTSRIDKEAGKVKVVPAKQIFVAEFPTEFYARRFSEVYAVQKYGNEFRATRIYSGAGLILKQMTWKTVGGFLMTALAISLGAPFWFDLLNKIVTLRSSIQPTQSKPSEMSTPESHQPTTPEGGKLYKVTPARERDHDENEETTLK